MRGEPERDSVEDWARRTVASKGVKDDGPYKAIARQVMDLADSVLRRREELRAAKARIVTERAALDREEEGIDRELAAVEDVADRMRAAPEQPRPKLARKPKAAPAPSSEGGNVKRGTLKINGDSVAKAAEAEREPSHD